MPPPPLPQPALAPGTCDDGLLPEVEVDEGGGGSQQAVALPVQCTAKEEGMTVSLPRHSEDEMEQLVDDVLKKKSGTMESGHGKRNNVTGSPRNSSKIHVHTVRDGELRVVDGGSVSQPDMQIIMDTFEEGGGNKGKENLKEKSLDAWVPQIINQDVIVDIDEVPTTDDASDTPVEDNATPSPAKASGTDIASVVPKVYPPFRQPTLFVPSSLAFPVDQGTVYGASKLAYLFAAPPSPGPFTFGKFPGKLLPFGAFNHSPTPGLIHPSRSTTSPFPTPQPASGSAQLSLKFTPHTPILTSTRDLKSGLSSTPQSTNNSVASDKLTSQTSPSVVSNGVSIQAPSALASTQASSDPFHRHMSSRDYASIDSLHEVLKSASSKSLTLLHPNIPITDTARNQHLARVRPKNANRMTASDRIVEPIIKAEEMEQLPMVVNRRISLMDAISPTVKKRLLPQEVVPLGKVQGRIDAAQDANSLKDIRNVQSRIYNEQHGHTPAKRQKLNDNGKDTELARQVPETNSATAKLLAYETIERIGTNAKVSGKTRELPVGLLAVNSSPMPQHSQHTITGGPSSAMNRQKAAAPSQLRFLPQTNQLYRYPPAAAASGSSSATSRQSALAQFVPGLPQQQPPPVNGLQADTIPKKLTVLTLPRLDLRANTATAQMALNIIDEANSLLSQYTNVQLAFSAHDMGFMPARLN